MTKAHFWLRHEVKPFEKRTPALPSHVEKLLGAGFKVTVEKSDTRCVADSEYEKLGCTMVEAGTWTSAPLDTVILGLKELPEDVAELKHKHIFFAHCYKKQDGWKEMIHRFSKSSGSIYDLEFCVDERGRRVAAFGRAAGYVGMALGIQAWAKQHEGDGSQTLGACSPYKDFTELASDTNRRIKEEAGSVFPKVIVIGALGRAGKGAVDAALEAGVPDENIARWDMAETKNGGPFPVILSDYDIMVNCVYLSSYIPPFISNEMLDEAGRRASVLVDVSCDTTNPNNPVPVYSENSIFSEPVIRVRAKSENSKAYDVISIDHLPSLVPYDSSVEFGDDLCNHLLEFDSSDVWQRVIKLYQEKVAEADSQ